MSESNYIQTDTIDPHVERRRAILKAHPEVKSLYGRNPATFGWILFLFFGQLIIAYLVKDASIWWVWALHTLLVRSLIIQPFA